MKKKAFTLLELMVVILIIGTLAALVIPRFVGRAEQAKVTRAKVDINLNIATALDLYELDNGFYPTTEQGLSALLTKPTTSPVPSDWRGPYLKRKPIDPWGNPYIYIYPGNHNPDSYDLYSYGKDGVEGGGDDITNWEE
jgi:general secretion pathway protein G